jgi:transposase-like protein
MSERKPKKKYSGEFKQMVIETMRSEHLSHREAARRFELKGKEMIANWERIYLEEGPEGLFRERRRRAGATEGRKPNLDKKVEEDLIAENQRLRAENDYLKKLNALVLEEERQNKRRK